jgi:hypothetical protein
MLPRYAFVDGLSLTKASRIRYSVKFDPQVRNREQTAFQAQ